MNRQKSYPVLVIDDEETIRRLLTKELRSDNREVLAAANAVEAQIFKALAEETRIKIVALLSNGVLCVCDIMEVLGLPQSTVSRHLAYLKNSEWVVGRRGGKCMYYQFIPICRTVPFKKPFRNILRRFLPARPSMKS